MRNSPLNRSYEHSLTRKGEFHTVDSGGDWYWGLQMPPGDPLPGQPKSGWVHVRFVPIDSRPVITAILPLETWESIVAHVAKLKGKQSQ